MHALTAPDRASGLAARDLRFRYFHPEGVHFKLPELTKTARQGQDPKSCFHASKTSIFAFVSAHGNMKLERFNGDHRTLQNLISFCYHT